MKFFCRLLLVVFLTVLMGAPSLRAELLTIEVPCFGNLEEEKIDTVMQDPRFQVAGTNAVFDRFPGVSLNMFSGAGGPSFVKIDAANARSTTVTLEGLPLSDPSALGGELDVSFLKGLLTDTFPSQLDLHRGDIMEPGALAEGGIIDLSLPKFKKEPGARMEITGGSRGYGRIDLSAHTGGIRVFGGAERGDGQSKPKGSPGFRTTEKFDSYTGGIHTFHEDQRGRSFQTLFYGTKARNDNASLRGSMHHRDFGLGFAKVSLPGLKIPSTFAVMIHGLHRWVEGSYSNHSHVFQGQWKGVKKREWGKIELLSGLSYEAGSAAAFSKTWGRGYLGILPIFQLTEIWSLGVGGRLEQVGSFFVPAGQIFLQAKTPKNFLKLSLSLGKRAPSFDQRYGASDWQLPNPELKPMSSVRLELDTRKYFHPFWVGVRAFGTRAYDDIVGVKVGHKWQSQNHVHTQGQGVEFYTYIKWKSWGGYVSHTMLSTYDARTKMQLAGIPKRKTLVGVTHTSVWGQWEISPFAELSLFGPQLLSPRGKVRGGYPLIRAGISFTQPGLHFFMRVENILDRKPELTPDASSWGTFCQGRMGLVGMAVEF